jgi:hypothetical protein
MGSPGRLARSKRCRGLWQFETGKRKSSNALKLSGKVQLMRRQEHVPARDHDPLRVLLARLAGRSLTEHDAWVTNAECRKVPRLSGFKKLDPKHAAVGEGDVDQERSGPYHGL